MRPLTLPSAEALEKDKDGNYPWESTRDTLIHKGLFWIWIIGNFIIYYNTDNAAAFLHGSEIIYGLIIFNITVISLFIVYGKLNRPRWRRNLKRIRHLEDLRLQEEQREIRRVDQLTAKAFDEAMKNEKERKISAFDRKNFQTGFNQPTNAQKEKAWKATGGKCSNYIFSQCKKSSEKIGLSFWWVIHPDLEVKVYCDSCARIEGLYREGDETDSRSRSISEDTKNQVWNRDKGKCVQCGSNEKLEFDHIIPFSKGGANTKRNIQLLCEPCNRRKSDKIG